MSFVDTHRCDQFDYDEREDALRDPPAVSDETRTMRQTRDVIASSLASQFRTKVARVIGKDGSEIDLERFIRDLANNGAQALGGDE